MPERAPVYRQPSLFSGVPAVGPGRRSAARRGYDRCWREARLSFLADHPLCRSCGGRGLVVAAAVVDHVTPHRGDESLFWDRTNWQSLCQSCHNRKTATADGGFGRPIPDRGMGVEMSGD